MEDHVKQLLEKIDERLGRIEDKLDCAASRGVKNETSISWIKTIGGFFATALMTITGWILYKLN